MDSKTLRHFLFAALLPFSPLALIGQSGLFLGEPLTERSPAVSASDVAALGGAFTGYSLFSLDVAGIQAHTQGTGAGRTAVRLKLGNEHDWDLRLEKHDLRGPDYVCRVATLNGVETLPKGEAFTYRGHLHGEPGSIARFSIRDDAVLGMILHDGEEYFIEPLAHFSPSAPADLVVVYRSHDVIADPNATCGSDEMAGLADDIGAAAPKDRDRDCQLADIALAADGSMVTFMGNVPAVETRLIDLLNWVDGRYQDPAIQIAYRLATIFISSSTAADPWTQSTDGSALLSGFASWGNSGGFGPGITYAVASIWTRRNIQVGGSSSVIGLAYVSVVCTQTRYNLNEHYTSGMLGPAVCQTHELGHNWSANHTASANSTYIMSPSIGTNNTQWDQAAINSITAHKNSRNCIGATCALVPIAQFSSDRALTCDGIVSFTDRSAYDPISWLWDFGDGNTSTDQNPTHTYANSGNYTVRLTASNANGPDDEVKLGYITVGKVDPPTATGGERCGDGIVDLQASGSHRQRWYTDQSGGTILHVGPTYSPAISGNTTFYVENSSEGDPVSAGAADNTIGTGGFVPSNTGWGLRFNVLRPLTIKSVKVYSGEAGDRTIELLDGSGNVVRSKVVSIPAGESRVTLDMDMTVGNQYLLRLTGPLNNLYRNTAGAAYPYILPGLVSITGHNGTAGTANYFYFYDWVVHEPGCSSERVPVNASVEACTGMDEIGRGGFSVRPNPSRDAFQIAWTGSSVRPVRFEVMNALGQKVHEEPVGAGTSLTLRIQGGPGLYFLRAFDAENRPAGEGKLVLE